MRQLGVAVTIVAVALAGAVAALFLWLRTYEPLAAAKPATPGAGLAADVEPTFGSGGKSVFLPTYRAGRHFDVTFTLRNTGRFAVTLTGIDADGGALVPRDLRPNAHVRIEPQGAVLVTVRWRLDCTRVHREVASDRVRLRYRYLSLFRRTAAVELPFAVALRCPGAPPASP